MQNYTLIVGSAYGDDSPDIYVVLAPDPKAAYDYVLGLDQGVKGTKRSVLFLMDGEVNFQPSLFPTRTDEMEFAAPTKIDLRPAWSQAPRRTPAEKTAALAAGFGRGAKGFVDGLTRGRAAGPPVREGESHGGQQVRRAGKPAALAAPYGDRLREQAPGIADVRDSIAAHDASRDAPAPSTAVPEAPAKPKRVRKPRPPKTPLEIASAAVDPLHQIVTRSPRKKVGRTSLITGKERATRKPSTGRKDT